MTRRAFCCLTISLSGMVAILQPACVFGQKAEPSNERQQVEAAWSHRKDAVTSVALVADVVEITKGRAKQAAQEDGPFSEDIPKTDRKVNAKVEYYFDKGKTALTEMKAGYVKEDGVKEEPLTYRATFDGQVTKCLREQAEHRIGSFEKKGEAASYISQSGALLAVNLWLQPQLAFRDMAWNTNDLKIENESTEVGGIRCRRIRIPRNTPRWTSALDVDVEKEWLPMQWQLWLDSRPTMKLVIRYGIDKNVGHAVSGWSYTRYDDTGEVEQTRSGHVTRCATNVEVAPNRFTIDFPIGTPIWEDIRGGRRYYVQKAEGMVPVEKDKPKGKRGVNEL